MGGTLDLDSLSEGPTEHVNDELRRRHDDVVWSIGRRGGEQRLHVLIEHQSSVDYSMPLRFLNYTSLLYQRLYRDRARWSRNDTAAPVLHVVVYNGDSRWDAPLALAGMVERGERDGAAQLAVSYDVVDLMALGRAELPRANLLTWVAEVEQSVHAGTLPERVRELGEWLAAEEEPELTRTFDLWLGALGGKWGVTLPSIREYEEASAVLANKIDRWEAEIRQQGVEQGIEREKSRLRRQAERRFGAAAAQQLAEALAGVTDGERLDEAGDWIVDSATAAEFLSRLRG